ncbi:MAG: selenide, water dikinase SelD [Bacteroidales bacterium]
MAEGPIRLTRYTHGLGCACKVRPQYLADILKGFPLPSDPNVLVGTVHSDDAAVYRISDETALVQSVDFFTPIVDDPYLFGPIAAANALNNIYAMGATPLFALNIVGFPTSRLPVHVLQSILKGASDKAAEAGIEILGGHTIEDAEPKFGMVVTGTVHPSRILTNSGARQGDVLVLTKPLGTGIIATAVKRGLADEQTAGQAARIMASLNAPAAQVLRSYRVHACTDITGFGLMGHLWELTKASGVNAEIWADKVPIIPGTEALVRAGAVPGGTKSNREHVSGNTIWDEGLSDATQWILCDAQTSGGLLVSMEENQANSFIRELLNDHGIRAVIIGQVTGKGKGNISVRP